MSPSKYPKVRGKRLHVVIAEEALGKPLPKGAAVHHFTPVQLVVCQSNGYHHLLHRRERAFRACGNPTWRRCWVCDRYDAPDKLFISKNEYNVYHRSCYNEYEREKRRAA